jgi:hypothetical protein
MACHICSVPVMKKIAPAERGGDEQEHTALDDAPWVEAVGERAGGNREQQERQPMRQHGEARQGGGMELLKQHPIADDVLDVVGHHRHYVSEELGAKARMAQCREGSLGGHRRGRGGRGHDVQRIAFTGDGDAAAATAGRLRSDAEVGTIR